MVLSVLAFISNVMQQLHMEGCRDIVLDDGISHNIKAIENCGVV